MLYLLPGRLSNHHSVSLDIRHLFHWCLSEKKGTRRDKVQRSQLPPDPSLPASFLPLAPLSLSAQIPHTHTSSHPLLALIADSPALAEGGLAAGLNVWLPATALLVVSVSVMVLHCECHNPGPSTWILALPLVKHTFREGSGDKIGFEI